MAQLYANFIKAETVFQLTYSLYFFALMAYGFCHFAPTFKRTIRSACQHAV